MTVTEGYQDLPVSVYSPSCLSTLESKSKIGWSGAVFSVLVGIALYRIFLHPLSHIPGPLAAKVTGLWRSSKYMGGKWHEDILDIHRTYGRVVRIAPNEISVVDEYAMKHL